MRRLQPPQIIVLSFLSAILIGTIALSLPIATKSGERLAPVDALFTATSATCVTGLIVKDTGNYFSVFGQLVILTLFQLGGLGIMTFSTLFAILLGRKLTIRHNIVIQGALNHHTIEGITTLIKYIILFTFSIELVGAGFLFLRWIGSPGMSPYQAAYYSIFHAVSAFCNAGFSLFSDSLIRFRNDGLICFVFTTLIILGGIGFVVFLDIPKFKFWRKDRALFFSRVSLQTKMVLTLTVCLILSGMLLLLWFERGNLFSGMGLKERLLASYFQAVTPRTAGFNTLPIHRLMSPSLLFLTMLMFIGASPGGTGGGIKTATFGIVLAAACSLFRNREDVTAFRKTIPKATFRRAFLVLISAGAWVFIFTLILSYLERGHSGNWPNYFLRIFFETTSAFGTVGLTTGITPHLTGLSKALMALTMLVGRVGPLTLIVAMGLREERIFYRYPEERVMVG